MVMDADAEPSGFLDYDVDMGTLPRTYSFPNVWRGFWGHSPHADDLIPTSEPHLADPTPTDQPSVSSLSGITSTTWQLTQGDANRRRNPADAKLLRRSTWATILTTDIQSDGSVADRKEPDLQTPAVDNIVHESKPEVVDTRQSPDQLLVSRSVSVPVHDDEERKRPTQPPMHLNLRDLVPVHGSTVVGRSRILSAIATSSEQRREHDDIPSTSSSRASTPPASPAVHRTRFPSGSNVDQQTERAKLFGLPKRITVSKREMNMMSPTSF